MKNYTPVISATYLFMIIFLPVLKGQIIIRDNYARFKHLTTENGLPGNIINSLLQDNKRYIWIGTDKGLSRYDGNYFKNYFSVPDDSTTLPDNYVMCIKQDSIGNIWVGTRNGLAYFSRENERFVRIPLISEEGKGLSSNRIRYVLPDKFPYIWVETEDGNLHYLNSETFISEIYPHERITQPYYNYHSIYKDSDDKLWIGGRNLGPAYFDIKYKTFSTIPADPQNPAKKRDNDVACYFEDSNNRFYVSATDGFYLYDRIKNIFTKKLATSTFQIAEDKEKNIWLATGGGLYKYIPEKEKFIQYFHNESDPASISSNHQNCLIIDAEDNIWTGTRAGINILLKQQTYIRHYRHIPSLEHTLNNNNVTSFFELNDSVIYTGTNGGGLNVFNTKTETFKNFTSDPEQKCAISANNVSVIRGDGNHLWIGLWRGIGFNRFDLKNNCFTRYAVNPNTYKVDWYNDFYVDDSDTLWCGIWGGKGIHFFDKKKGVFLDKNFQPRYHPDNTPLFGQVTNGNFIITSGLKGVIYLFNNETKTFYGFVSDKNENNAKTEKLKTGHIPSYIRIYDGVTSGKITMLTTNKGVLRFNADNTTFDSVEKLSYRSNAITKSSEKDSYWIASERGLEYYNDIKKESFLIEKTADKNSPLFNNEIFSLFLKDKTALLIATAKGLLIYNPVLSQFVTQNKTGNINKLKGKPIKKITRFPDGRFGFIFNQGFAISSSSFDTVRVFNIANSFNKRMPTDIIFDIIQDNNEHIFLLATDMGIIKYDEGSSVFNIIDKLKEYTIHSFLPVGNKLSLCTDKGYLQYIPASDSLIPYNNPPSDKLTSHLISFLHEDSEGNIWAGTTNRGVNKINPATNYIDHYFSENRKGFSGTDALCFLQTNSGDIYIGGEKLNRYDKSKDCFVTPVFANKLPQEEIKSLLEDKNNNIWIITSGTIFKYIVENDSLINISKLTGLKNLTFTRGALEEKSGKFLIGSNRGFIRFFPDDIKQNILNIPVQITGISVFGKDVKINNEENGSITLNYDENFLEIKFSTMSFSPVSATYEYMLEGIDKTWVKTTRPSTSYTKIQPGEYMFKVRNSMAPETTLSELNIYIKPPFWKTWWFKSLIILTIVLIITYWWRLRLNKVRVLENNLKLKQRLLLSQLNPHFIFNILTAIQNFIYQNKPQESGKYLSKFAKLMRLVLENMRSDFTSIEKERNTLQYYLEMQKLRFNDSFDFEIQITGNGDLYNMAIPTMVLQPLVENAVEHGMRKIKKGGKINIRIDLKNSLWNVTIVDNGSGINEGSTGNNKSHKSISTKILQERIEAFNKRKNNNTFYIKFSNLANEKSGQSGTKVILVLPAIPVTKSD
ncbi:MAG: hypothetical protein GXO47_10070 [Chlorobi bacterium]|nr:hypothetical protein [Chlorobiota bacterium]